MRLNGGTCVLLLISRAYHIPCVPADCRKVYYLHYYRNYTNEQLERLALAFLAYFMTA